MKKAAEVRPFSHSDRGFCRMSDRLCGECISAFGEEAGSFWGVMARAVEVCFCGIAGSGRRHEGGAAECGIGRGVLHTMDSGRISMPPTQEEV